MDKKPGLGKGLSALFEEKKIDIDSISSEPQKQQAGVAESPGIAVEKISINPYQPREDFNDEELKELTESVKKLGVIQPITVRFSDNRDGYILIAGERRLRAAKDAGLTQIPAYIYTDSDGSIESMIELALIENVQRTDLNPMELSNAYQRLIDECNLTQEEIAQKISKQRSTVANYLRLQKLPAEIKVSLRKNEITEGHARMLLRIEDKEAQIELWKRILRENISVRKLEEITKNYTKPRKKKEEKKQEEKNPHIKELEDKLIRFFGTKVRIKQITQQSGEIIIEFYSNNDLERIMDKCE